MNQKHRDNLAKLATYLEGLPKSYKHFQMHTFAGHNGTCPLGDVDQIIIDDPEKFYTNCGTIACAIGHGPAAGIKIPKAATYTCFYAGRQISWDRYSYEMFCPEGDEWHWMFSGEWKGRDNTHRGAAARIRYVLAGRRIPLSEDKEGDFQPRRDHRALYAEFVV